MDDESSWRDGARVGRVGVGAGPAPRASVAIGFGSPADESGLGRLDLNDILVRNPQATFLMRVAGDAMRSAGIANGDLVLIDRAVTPVHGHVVVAVVEQDFVCRRLVTQGGPRLCSTDPAVGDIVPAEGEGFEIWGVVTTAIKSIPV